MPSHGNNPNTNFHYNQAGAYSYNEFTKSKNFQKGPAHYPIKPIRKPQTKLKGSYANTNSHWYHADQVKAQDGHQYTRPITADINSDHGLI